MNPHPKVQATLVEGFPESTLMLFQFEISRISQCESNAGNTTEAVPSSHASRDDHGGRQWNPTLADEPWRSAETNGPTRSGQKPALHRS